MNSGCINSETWASSRPIIQSSRVDPNYVEEGVNGVTFDVDDPEQLAQKIRFLLERPELCSKMGRSGRELVETRLLYPHLIAQYLRGYAQHGVVE